MTDEWGQWITHDGRGCPKRLIGKFVECLYVFENGYVSGYRCNLITDLFASCESWNGAKHLGSGALGTWDGKEFKMEYVTHYRIRKPRALQELADMIENLPESVSA